MKFRNKSEEKSEHRNAPKSTPASKPIFDPPRPFGVPLSQRNPEIKKGIITVNNRPSVKKGERIAFHVFLY